MISSEVNKIKIEDVVESDGLLLAELRARAMRPSLEKIGRFDEGRVRNRFLEGFNPAETWKITIDEKTVGFYVFRNRRDHWYLDHLYIEPGFQGLGIGASVIETIKNRAAGSKLPVRLGALKGSRANDFYRTCGFAVTHEDEFDIYYEWQHH